MISKYGGRSDKRVDIVLVAIYSAEAAEYIA